MATARCPDLWSCTVHLNLSRWHHGCSQWSPDGWRDQSLGQESHPLHPACLPGPPLSQWKFSITQNRKTTEVINSKHSTESVKDMSCRCEEGGGCNSSDFKENVTGHRASLTTYPLIWHHSNSCLSHTRHETLSNKVLITSSFKHPYIISVLSLLPCCHLLCRYHELNLKNPAAPMTYYLSFRPIINSKNSFLWSFRLCLPLLIQKWWSVTLNCQPW